LCSQRQRKERRSQETTPDVNTIELEEVHSDPLPIPPLRSDNPDAAEPCTPEQVNATASALTNGDYMTVNGDVNSGNERVMYDNDRYEPLP